MMPYTNTAVEPQTHTLSLEAENDLKHQCWIEVILPGTSAILQIHPYTHIKGQKGIWPQNMCIRPTDTHMHTHTVTYLNRPKPIFLLFFAVSSGSSALFFSFSFTFFLFFSFVFVFSLFFLSFLPFSSIRSPTPWRDELLAGVSRPELGSEPSSRGNR